MAGKTKVSNQAGKGGKIARKQQSNATIKKTRSQTGLKGNPMPGTMRQTRIRKVRSS